MFPLSKARNHLCTVHDTHICCFSMPTVARTRQKANHSQRCQGTMHAPSIISPLVLPLRGTPPAISVMFSDNTVTDEKKQVDDNPHRKIEIHRSHEKRMQSGGTAIASIRALPQAQISTCGARNQRPPPIRPAHFRYCVPTSVSTLMHVLPSDE